MIQRIVQFSAAMVLLGALCCRTGAQAEAPLPAGVRAVWDVAKADRQATATRERVCLNGLWRWQPAGKALDRPPAERWGFFKVPGAWPGITDYMQKDSQTAFPHPAWKGEDMRALTAAWYQRELTVPESWVGRRIVVRAEYLNSHAAVFLDGNKVGEMRFPAGEVDLTASCRPGGKHVLSMLVTAMPLEGVMLSFSDTASAREVKGSVARRGLCGDVFLAGVPAGPRITDVKVDTSIRKGEIALDVALQGLAADKEYILTPEIVEEGKEAGVLLMARRYRSSDLKNGRLAYVVQKWKPGKLWDTHTPQNQYRLTLTLSEGPGRLTEAHPPLPKIEGKILDTALPVRFGFREFWIDGRDFYLNGSRVYLSAVPLDNAQVSAAASTYEAARESMLRLQSFGINFVYTHNYGCEPGTHLAFAEILRAADDVGMLVALSQPHFGQYKWDANGADANNGYAGHAEFYVRVAGSHPSVVMYSMSHNATGYAEDMNPDLIDGKSEPRDQWSERNAKKALRAEAIVRRLDPGRIVYHHSSGNLGSMHTVNFYPNFTPIQEMSDWLEHWATVGVKPLFFCEYGVPFSWDWAMYRGWYKGVRTFGSAKVPWEFCLAEWNSQFLGDDAFRVSEKEKKNLRWEAKQFRDGKLWNRWDYPHQLGSVELEAPFPILAAYLADNWRAFRAWGLSANSPWEHGLLYRPREGVDRSRKELKVDWDKLQRPGFSPDYIGQQYERMDLAFERSDWVATPWADALLRNNRPLLAYVAGKGDHFTEKSHIFTNGETVEKQLIVINNSRQAATCDCQWSLRLPRPVGGTKTVTVETGQQARVPLRFDLPVELAAGHYALTMKATFSGGEVQEDSFAIHVVPKAAPPRADVRIALFDPNGETAGLLKDLAVRFDTVRADADLSSYDVLVIGKHALTPGGAAPDTSRVAGGLKVIVFEQSADALEKRLGFRVQEYGLRQVFARVPDHPAIGGLGAEHLRDWRGEAANTAPRLKYTLSPKLNYVPVISWCGIEVPRVWRAGNRGNVASVLIEKPARGDFLPIVDGGFSLQYSPLMEYREGKGVVMFCQLDVTGRTESDPAARIIARNLLEYVAAWKPQPRHEVLYAGEAAGKKHLEAAGLVPAAYVGQEPKGDAVLVVGPGGGETLADKKDAVAAFLKGGGRVLAVGLGQKEAQSFLPFAVTMKDAEHISAFFDPPSAASLLAGVGPADVHSRDPRTIPLVSGGAAAGGTVAVGDGVLALASGPDSNAPSVVFCQLAPWQFEYKTNYGLKRTFRRTSFLLTRLLANLGAAGATPLLDRFGKPSSTSKPESRWLDGLYLDQPEEWDDPYRFFRW